MHFIITLLIHNSYIIDYRDYVYVSSSIIYGYMVGNISNCDSYVLERIICRKYHFWSSEISICLGRLIRIVVLIIE